MRRNICWGIIVVIFSSTISSLTIQHNFLKPQANAKFEVLHAQSTDSGSILWGILHLVETQYYHKAGVWKTGIQYIQAYSISYRCFPNDEWVIICCLSHSELRINFGRVDLPSNDFQRFILDQDTAIESTEFDTSMQNCLNGITGWLTNFHF